MNKIKGALARSRERARYREQHEIALIEAINRVKEARNNQPKEWQRAYNSAITQIEFLLDDVRGKKWP